MGVGNKCLRYRTCWKKINSHILKMFQFYVLLVDLDLCLTDIGLLGYQV